jgi:uncharacterized protein (DUF362 family)
MDLPDFKKLNPDKETYIKINANYDKEWPGCNTSPWFLDYLLKNLRKNGFNTITAVEGDLKQQPALHTIKAIQFDKILQKHNVPFLPLENLERENEIPCILKRSQLISTPVLHTHTFATISVATKNLFGILPVYRERYHEILNQKLTDLNKQLKIFTIVDGTVGLEGGSMRMGNPVRTDLLLAGWDPLSIDCVAAKIMGFERDEVPLLRYAKNQNLFKPYVISGDFDTHSLPSFSFTAPQPQLSKIDLFLRNNLVTKTLFSYNSFFDILGNRVRRLYLNLYYKNNVNKISNGSWTEYKNNWLNNP